MDHQNQRRSSIREAAIIVLLSPLIVAALVFLVLVAPFVWMQRLFFRALVELKWGCRGKRILLVYSDSPHWKEYVESRWLPRLAQHAVVLNWSRRPTWRDEAPFARRVFEHWAPRRDFNPMALLFPPLRPARRVGFYYAFRDARHGKTKPLREAESTVFEFVESLEQSS